MAVGVPDYALSEVVEFAGRVSGGKPRGNAYRAEHDRHRRGEVVGVAGLGLEQEPLDAVGVGRRGVYALRVGELRAAQVRLYHQRLVQRVVRFVRQPEREVADARGERRGQLEVVVGYEVVVFGGGFAQVVVGGERDVGDHAVGFVLGYSFREAPRDQFGGYRSLALERDGFDGIGRIGFRFDDEQVFGQPSGDEGARSLRGESSHVEAYGVRKFVDVRGEVDVAGVVVHVYDELPGGERFDYSGFADPDEPAASQELVGLEAHLHGLVFGLALQAVAGRGRQYVGAYLDMLGLGGYPALGRVVVVGLRQPVGRIVAVRPGDGLAAEGYFADEGQPLSEEPAGVVFLGRQGGEQPGEEVFGGGHGRAPDVPYLRGGGVGIDLERKNRGGGYDDYAEPDRRVQREPADAGAELDVQPLPRPLHMDGTDADYQQHRYEQEEEEARRELFGQEAEVGQNRRAEQYDRHPYVVAPEYGP